MLNLDLLETRLAPSATYYVSPSGDDSRDGLSPALAWQTLERVNRHPYEPGDTILFQGGAEFSGSLRLFTGDPDSPITFSSYGTGRATIVSGAARGLWSCSPGGLHVAHLNFTGSGADSNNTNGIEFCNYGATTGRSSHFYIDHVDVSGYGIAGIALMIDPYGMDDVRVTNAVLHHNANGLIAGYGADPGLRAITNLYIGWTRAYNNDRTAPGMAGVGISLDNIASGIIERSLFHDNGQDSLGPGHAGLLVNNSSNLLVQYNEAFRNLDPAHMDGQGLAFNGVTDSVIQYNYLHDNDSGGIQVMGDEAAFPSLRNTVRYNISENDTVGLVLFQYVSNTDFYNNTIWTNPDAATFRTSLVVMEWSGTNVNFRNNLFQVTGTGPVLVVDDASVGGAANLTFQNNVYGGPTTYFMYGPTGYYSLLAWRLGTGHELLNGLPVGFTANPRLQNPGGGGTIGDPGRLDELTAYHLRSDSPYRLTALDLGELFGIDPGTRDYFGNTLMGTGRFSIGAYQVPGGMSPTDPGAPGQGGMLPWLDSVDVLFACGPRRRATACTQ